MSLELVSGGDRRPPDEGDVAAVARELFEAGGLAAADRADIGEPAYLEMWNALARHVLAQRSAACHLAEKTQQVFGEVGYYPAAVEACFDALQSYWKVAPHDRGDCPCIHPPGTPGHCGGCNCADDE